MGTGAPTSRDAGRSSSLSGLPPEFGDVEARGLHVGLPVQPGPELPLPSTRSGVPGAAEAVAGDEARCVQAASSAFGRKPASPASRIGRGFVARGGVATYCGGLSLDAPGRSPRPVPPERGGDTSRGSPPSADRQSLERDRRKPTGGARDVSCANVVTAAKERSSRASSARAVRTASPLEASSSTCSRRSTCMSSGSSAWTSATNRSASSQRRKSSGLR